METRDTDTRIPPEFALMQDLSKQLITLCTAFVAVSLLFVREVLPDDPLEGEVLLILAWAASVTCIVSAMAVLNTIAAYWGQRLKEERGDPILYPVVAVLFGHSRGRWGQVFWTSWLRFWQVLQWYTFPASVGLFMWFAWLNIT